MILSFRSRWKAGSLLVCFVALWDGTAAPAAAANSLEEASRNQGCTSPPVPIEGTDLYKCQTNGAMSYFVPPDTDEIRAARAARQKIIPRKSSSVPELPRLECYRLTEDARIACLRSKGYGEPVPKEIAKPFPIAIPLERQAGTFVVPVLINNALTLKFVVDSGATDVTLPADVVLTLVRTGTLQKTDFLGERTYVLADGSRVPSQTFLLRSMKIGDRVLDNVTASVTSVSGTLLLGQSFLGRFGSWSIDNDKHTLLLSPGQRFDPNTIQAK